MTAVLELTREKMEEYSGQDFHTGGSLFLGEIRVCAVLIKPFYMVSENAEYLLKY